MAQYLNPYEGIGNALINIGQDYALDLRRKREAEEDQKRRRADYLWQSKQEEERANREYERDAPKREMEAKLAALRAAELAARTTKAEIEARMAAGGRIINLPAGGGSIRQKLDDNGNLVEERIPYVPAPDRARAPRPVEGIDPVTGMKSLFDPATGQTTNTGLLSAAPSTDLTAYQKQQRAQSRLAALQRVESLSNEQIADSIGVSKRDTAAISAERARRRKMVEDTYADASSAPSAAPAPRSFGATAIDSIGQGLMKIGNAVTTTEDSVMADLPEAPAPKNKAKEEPEMSYSAAAAMVKAKRPDLTDEQIARYLKSKGITPPKQKKN